MNEPAIDLGICLAIASSSRDVVVDDRLRGSLERLD